MLAAFTSSPKAEAFYGKQSVLTTLQFDGEIVVPKDLNNSELEKKDSRTNKSFAWNLPLKKLY